MSVGTRYYKLHQFTSGSTDPTVVIPIGEGGAAGKIAVFVKRISGTGTATLAVDGSFKSVPTADDLVSIKTATSVGTGALTDIVAPSDNVADAFPYLSLTLDRTGTSAVNVYVVAY